MHTNLVKTALFYSIVTIYLGLRRRIRAFFFIYYIKKCQQGGFFFHLLLKELQVFLSFIVSRTDIAPYITEFNKQSKSSIIEVDTNGMVKIQKK